MILQHPPPYKKRVWYSGGVNLMSYSHRRDLPEIKTTNYSLPILLRHQLKKVKAHDVIYHQDKIISESSRANFFMINQQGELVNPKKDILKGITRKKVLSLVKDQLTVKEKTISLTDVFSAKEAFLTSTTKSILPVTRIDGNPIGTGQPGSITKSIIKKFDFLKKEYVSKNYAE